MTHDRSFYASFFRMAILLSAQNLIVLSVSLIDNIMLGSYSEAALAGASLANQIQFIFQSILMAIGTGVTLYVSQYWGKQKANGQNNPDSAEMDACRRVSTIGLTLALAAAVFFFALVTFFPQSCLSFFTNDPSIIQEGCQYLEVLRFSYIFFALSNLLFAMLRSVETVYIGTLASVVSLLTNLVLNYALIFGHWGAPRLGIYGAAAATCIARLLEFLIALLFVWKADCKLCYFAYRPVWDGALFRKYIRTTIPVMISDTLWGLAMAGSTAILGRMGSAAITANSISNAIFQMIFVFTDSNANTASVLTAKSIGAQAPLAKIKENTRALQVIFITVGVISALALWALEDPILTLYPEIDPASIAMTRSFIHILCITCCIGSGYQLPCNCGIVRGGGDTGFVLKMDLIMTWLYMLPVSAFVAFALHASPTTVFFVLKSDQLIKCVIAFVKTNRYRWIKRLIPMEASAHDAPM